MRGYERGLAIIASNLLRRPADRQPRASTLSGIGIYEHKETGLLPQVSHDDCDRLARWTSHSLQPGGYERGVRIFAANLPLTTCRRSADWASHSPPRWAG